MRLAAFSRPDGDERRVALVVGEGTDLRLHPFPEGVELVALLALDPAERAQAAEEARSGGGLGLDEVRLLPPVYPVAMRDFLTFHAHVEGMERGNVPAAWYDAPVFLFMAPHAVVGAFDDVAYPPETERLDFELELAVVICRDVRNETPEQAASAIGGYCAMNDWSARDVQGKEMSLRLGPSKGKDFATTIGPWVVTADEMEQYRSSDGRLDVAMSVSVNGTQLGADRSGNMAWSFEELVSHASRASWVKAGEVLASGTCSQGSLAESWGRTGRLEPAPLQVGDTVEVTIEGVGSVRNRVVASTETVPPAPRARVQPRGA
ncbi:fumarylacetoacetate hydrolase family protein [Actinomycetota bacterium]